MPSKNLSLSVVIPNHNGQHLLARHLPQVLRSIPQGEIIVVDDASTDESVAYLRNNFPRVKVVVMEKNVRFAQACNEGVNVAQGEIVLLLNSDVAVDKTLLPGLLTPFEDKDVFAVGCQEKTFEGDRMIVQGKAGGAFKRGFLIHWRCDQQIDGPTLWAFGGSSAYHRSKWLELGGMDPLFAPAYEEDRDICYRAWKRGWKVLFTTRSQVRHEHESTNINSLGKKVMQISSYKNQCIFVWKNISQSSLLCQHVLWLPYHLLFTTVRSRGTFFQGFLQALRVLPLIREQRKRAHPYEKITDRQVLSLANN